MADDDGRDPEAPSEEAPSEDPEAPSEAPSEEAPSEAPPEAPSSVTMVVSGGRGALVRETAASDGAKVDILPVGTVCVGRDCASVDDKVRVELASPVTGWVSLKLLRVEASFAASAAPARSLECALITLDWFGRHYGGRFASAARFCGVTSRGVF